MPPSSVLHGSCCKCGGGEVSRRRGAPFVPTPRRDCWERLRGCWGGGWFFKGGLLLLAVRADRVCVRVPWWWQTPRCALCRSNDQQTRAARPADQAADRGKQRCVRPPCPAPALLSDGFAGAQGAPVTPTPGPLSPPARPFQHHHYVERASCTVVGGRGCWAGCEGSHDCSTLWLLGLNGDEACCAAPAWAGLLGPCRAGCVSWGHH